MLEQNAFSLAAFTDERGDIPFINLQIDSIQNRPTVKLFGNILKFYDRRIHRGTPYIANQSAPWAIGSTTTRTAGGLDFTAKGGKRQRRAVPLSLWVEPGAKHSV